MKIFISGSKSINSISAEIKNYIMALAKDGNEFIIGDCFGVDLAVQKFLFEKNVNAVTVYCSGETPRYNVGNWKVKAFGVKDLKGYDFYRVKDVQMALDADFGLFVWDGKSRGTKNNIEEMKKLGKPFIIFSCSADFY